MSKNTNETDITLIVILIISVLCAVTIGKGIGIFIGIILFLGYIIAEIAKEFERDNRKSNTYFSISEEKDNGKEQEMENYGLFEEEKELVRKGEYDSWQFEEEDMDEDDYYYEDE